MEYFQISDELNKTAEQTKKQQESVAHVPVSTSEEAMDLHREREQRTRPSAGPKRKWQLSIQRERRESEWLLAWREGKGKWRCYGRENGLLLPIAGKGRSLRERRVSFLQGKSIPR